MMLGVYLGHLLMGESSWDQRSARSFIVCPGKQLLGGIISTGFDRFLVDFSSFLRFSMVFHVFSLWFVICCCDYSLY